MDFLSTIKPVMRTMLTSKQPLPSIFERVSDGVIGLVPLDSNGNLNPLILGAFDEESEDLADSLLSLVREYNPKHLCVAGLKDGDAWMTGISVKIKDKVPVITFGNETFPYTFMNLSRDVLKDRKGESYMKVYDVRENGFRVPVFMIKDIGVVTLKAIKAEPHLYIQEVGSGSSIKSYHATIEKGIVYEGEVVFPKGKEPFIHVTSKDGNECNFSVKVPKKNLNNGTISRLVQHVVFQIAQDDSKESVSVDGKSYQCWQKPLDILDTTLKSIDGLYDL